MSRITEDTLLDVFLNELREKGLKAQSKPSYVTLYGKRIPDARVMDGGEYLIEADVGETKLGESVGQIYDYLQHIPSQGGFSVIFPERLREYAPLGSLREKMLAPKYDYLVMGFYKDPGRPPQQHKGSFNEILNWVVEQVLYPPVKVEYDVDLAVKVVKSIVESLRDHIAEVEGDRLVEIFGGRPVFENILQYEEEEYPLEEMRRAAGYLLVNQILFYQVLSKTDPTTYKEIDHTHLENPAELRNKYFTKVLERNFTPTFGFDVSSIIDPKATQSLSKLIAAVKALEPHKASQDILGQVFQRLIPYNVRKAVAAFYTNPNAAELLANLAIDNPEAEVMDLAVGSGTLLVAAYRRKRKLHEAIVTGFGEEDHRRFLEEQLTGIDIMPFAAHLAVVHLSLQGLLTTKEIPIFETEKVRTAIWDSTELRPDTVIPEISRELKKAYLGQRILDEYKEGPLKVEYLEKGAMTTEGLGGRQIPLKEVSLVIMNPPFTRQERLPKEYKESLNRRLKEYGDKLHGQLGLYGYFIFLAHRFLRSGGRLALVLPATALRISSTQGIRDLFSEDYELEHIITTYQRAAFSEGAQFREILLVARKTRKKPVEEFCTVSFLKKLPEGISEARELANELRIRRRDLGAGGIFDSEKLSVRNVTQRMIRENSKNLFRFVACEDPRLLDTWDSVGEKAQDRLVKIDSLAEKLGATIIRGAETARGGSIQAMCINEPSMEGLKKRDVWIVEETARDNIVTRHRFLKTSVKIPRRVLYNHLRRLSGVSKMDITGRKEFVVGSSFPHLRKFLAFGTNVDENKVSIDFIKDWNSYVDDRAVHVALARRFDLSAVGTILVSYYSSNLFVPPGVMWGVRNLEKEDAKIIALWFNSTINLLQIFIDRVETRGAWMQIHKYALENLRTIDPTTLSDDEKNDLLALFGEVENVEFPSFIEQLDQPSTARRKIDEEILKILGLEKEEISELLDYLYQALHKEILRLKELMAG